MARVWHALISLDLLEVRKCLVDLLSPGPRLDLVWTLPGLHDLPGVQVQVHQI